MLKRILDRDSHLKLIQFLMGLNHQHEYVKTTILFMDLLPTLTKTFALLQNIDKQKQITDVVEVLAEANAYACADNSDGVASGSKKPKYNSYTGFNGVKTCSYCHQLGHTKEKCFKLKECSHCCRKGHAKKNCFGLRNSRNNKFDHGKGRGKSEYCRGRRGSHHADVIAYGNDDDYYPIDDIPANTNLFGASPQTYNTCGTEDSHMNDLVDTVMQKVLQALSDKPSPSLVSSTNFAGKSWRVLVR
ncbi:hypothetical protein RND81_04G009300 [Saponaria officinalis]|uniref:Uncharacterized protein n=1 Tax=Saponaria officinalis TaxID=3572 RepID=A0AAW1LGK3_SAPOF